MKNILFSLIFITIFCLPGQIFSQDKKNKNDEGYKFTAIKELKATSVKDQYRTGTCWCFATVSFLESELLRLGKSDLDLSEMFVVRHAYSIKALNYVRFQGTSNFSQGGQAHDVLNVIRKKGIVPESVYPGLNYGEELHTHGELSSVLSSMLDAVIKNRNKKLSTCWYDAFNAVLDVYLGEDIKNFEYNGKSYTPVEFSSSLGINPDDYVELTSYTHHPFYEKFILEIPDNWSDDYYYNLPIDELMKVMEEAINKGYTVAWDGDISDKGFSWRNGVAILPEKDFKDMTDTEQTRWEEMSSKEKEEQLYKFDKPGKEKTITQDIRQQAFDNYSTTDDHLMHFTGIAKDQAGTKYFITKNSWAVKGHKYNGYLHMSEAFVRLNTIAIMVHKDAIPEDIRKKLNIK